MMKSINLIILTKVDGRLVAVLRRKGKFNTVGMDQTEYPGSCEISCKGSIEGDESAGEALARHMQKQLGPKMTDYFLRNMPNFMRPLSRHLGEVGPRKEILTNSFFHPSPLFLQEILLQSHNVLELIHEETPLWNLPSFSKEKGVQDLSVIALTAEEIVAVQTAFERYGKTR